MADLADRAFGGIASTTCLAARRRARRRHQTPIARLNMATAIKRIVAGSGTTAKMPLPTSRTAHAVSVLVSMPHVPRNWSRLCS